ncbi:histidine kinase [Chelatococcus sp. GCM10030263]|uniref:histidine kinase n=1 Tax=Chelatococcus sp. GCM10030263 TaxID=3273387 RepID=UPI0036121577
MADYYTLLQRAIAGLPESTPESREAIYERARAVLVQQLRNVQPPLADAEIDREYAALDAVIARIEAEIQPLQEPDWTQGEDLRDFELPPDDTQAADHAIAEPRSQEARDADYQANGSPSRERPRLTPARPKTDLRVRLRRWLVAGVLAVAIAAIAGVAYMLRDQAPDLSQQTGQAPPQEQGDGKIAERLGGPGEAASEAAPAAPAPAAPTQPAPGEAAPPAGSPPAPGAPAVAVAQRAVLYEESPENPQVPTTHAGRTVWRIDSLNPGQGEQLETVVHADIDIPSAGFAVTMVIRRNTDATLPASHTVELRFRNTSGDANRDVRDVGVMQLKSEEGGRGTPLAGLPVPVTENFFLIGLSNLSADVDRNTDLLKTRGWIDLPLRFANGRRAVLTFEKGVAGDQAINEAFRLWQ